MNYRVQDLMTIIIPGLYVVALVLGWLFLSPDQHIDLIKLQDFEGLILLMIPFIGFVAGYLVECVMSLLEQGLYCLGVKRPSRAILSGGVGGLYLLAEKDNLLSRHAVSGELTNSKSYEILQCAKQSIDRGNVEVFRINSILARNIFGGQLCITFLYGFVSPCFLCDFYFYIAVVVAIIFLIYWFHHTHVYVLYVLAEYGKILSRSSYTMGSDDREPGKSVI